MSYTQAERPMRVETALGTDALLLEGMSGVEGVSRPFSFRLDLLSEDDDVAAADLLRTPAVVTLKLADGAERTFHGLVRRFVHEGRQEELTSYQAEIVPWLWFLSLSRESRIHQNVSVPEILETVFRGLGHADFELRCTRSYPKREFCVQYRETHLDFVSRLMEEEGIFYFFEHSPERHLLVVADDNSAVKPCPGAARARMAPQGTSVDGSEDVVATLQWEEQACVGKVVLRDYDFLQPSLNLESSIAGNDPEETYDYPGEFTAPDEGERYARIRLEEAGALRQVVRGQGTVRAFQSGCRFDLVEHARDAANQAYMLLQVQHVATAGDYRGRDAAPMEYRNHFAAIPHAVTFRPQRVTPHPLVRGTQTALVVGPAGEEVWVDSHGRIKVQFYWDRIGKKDENSSCWIRVAQPWAGKGYGAVQIPRIGSEVVVEFLEGDPDRPLVTGCVYNADQTPPFTLPGAGIQMGMKSRSSPGGGGHNEITMTDTKGKEAVTVHAQYNMGTTVQNDQTNTINNNRSSTVAVNDTTNVGSNREVHVSANLTETVGGAMSETVTGTKSESVGSSKTESVGSSKSLTIGTLYSVSVGAAMMENVGAAKVQDIGAALMVNVGGMSSETVGAGKSVTAAKISESASGMFVAKAGAKMDLVSGAALTVDGKTVTINAKSKIVLKCGGASITMTSGGNITIKGAKITVTGSGKVKIKGSKIEEN